MYSTRFDDELRYVVTCITNRDIVRVVETIVDTGAKYTCYRASLIDDELHEEDLGTNQSVEIGGFVSGDEPINKVRFYRYPLRQFTIGSIDLGKRDIWITFDGRVKDNVLGMDILKSVSFMQYADARELHFFTDEDELKSFVEGKLR